MNSESIDLNSNIITTVAKVRILKHLLQLLILTVVKVRNTIAETNFYIAMHLNAL